MRSLLKDMRWKSQRKAPLPVTVFLFYCTTLQGKIELEPIILFFVLKITSWSCDGSTPTDTRFLTLS